MAESESDVAGTGVSTSQFVVTLTPLHRETAEVTGVLELGPSQLPFFFGRRRHHNEGASRQPRGEGILIDDTKPIQVSRDHCALDVRDGKVIVVDRGSTLGTIIDKVKLGRKVAVFEFPLEEGKHRLVLGNVRSRHRFDLEVSYAKGEKKGGKRAGKRKG